MQKPQFFSRMEEMKTYVRQWWFLNRLYHFMRLDGYTDRANKKHFRIYLAGYKDQKNLFDEEGNIKDPSKPFIFRWPLSLFLSDTKNYSDLVQQMDAVIKECIDKKWIQSTTVRGAEYLELSTEGKDRYALSSLVFGDISGIRKFLLGIISFSALWAYSHSILKWFLDIYHIFRP